MCDHPNIYPTIPRAFLSFFIFLIVSLFIPVLDNGKEYISLDSK